MSYWYVPNGVHLPAWFPATEGPLVDLPETLRPLTFARDYLNCFHGLTHNTALTNGDTEGCGHGQGSASFLTGAQALKTQDAVRVGISADQLYARHVGNATRLPSLELGCESARSGNAFGYSGTYKTHISWRAANAPAPYEINPKIVFDRLFTRGGGKLTKGTVADRDFYRRSMLDYVLDDARRVRNQVAKADQRKLDQYLTGVREVERRIQHPAAAVELPTADFPRPGPRPCCRLMESRDPQRGGNSPWRRTAQPHSAPRHPMTGFRGRHHVPGATRRPRHVNGSSMRDGIWWTPLGSARR